MEPCRQDRGPTLGELLEEALAALWTMVALWILFAGVGLAVFLVVEILAWAGLVQRAPRPRTCRPRSGSARR